MQYLLLIYENEANRTKRSEGERAKMYAEYGEFTQGIVKSGHFRAGEPLQPVAAATTVRVKDGKTVTTAGPFAETAEQLGGYYVIDAKDPAEAVAIAARIPAARTGSIEIRPIMDIPRPQS